MSDRMDRRRFLLTGTAALGASLLAGCGRDDTPASTAAAASAGADDTPRRGGRLRLGIIDGDQAGNLDVHKPSSTGSIIRGFALYSKLWEWTPDMTPTLALAEEAEVSPDATHWTLRLRPGLEFHHGKTISADDVVFSILRLTDPELASPYAGLVSAVDRSRVVKLDERTVRVHFKEGRGFVPLPDTWVNFGGIVPTDYHPVTNPVGAGPYRLKEFLPGRRSLFVRFDTSPTPTKSKSSISRTRPRAWPRCRTARSISPTRSRPSTCRCSNATRAPRCWCRKPMAGSPST
jgi:peptide/nickel transport system substrate-binding protein